jgi:GTP-binding protein
VSPVRGTTRDRLYGQARWRGRAIGLIDMGGAELGRREPLAAAVQRHVERAVEEAQVLVLICDAREGLLPADEMLAERLRRTGKPLLLVVNKADAAPLAVPPEFFRLGIAPTLPVSALHGHGAAELLDALAALMLAAPQEARVAYAAAIIGRPNVGKSSLFNALAREERALVSEVPGTTRDVIDTDLLVGGERVRLLDTAGLKARRKVAAPVEWFSMARTLEAIGRCDVALLVLDATEALTREERRIIHQVAEAGRGLVLVANKWDLVARPDVAAFRRALLARAPWAAFAPVVPVSAITGFQVERLLPLARRVALGLRRGLTDAQCLAGVRAAWRQRPLRLAGRPARLVGARWISQPPGAALTLRPSGALPRAWAKFMANRLQAHPGLLGVPVRVTADRGHA